MSPAMEMLLRWITPLARVAHRPSFEGAEHLLAHGAYVLVGNHSAMIASAELTCLCTCWMERFGTARPIAALAHPVSFFVWPLPWIVRGLGAIPSSHEHARRVLAGGIPIVVFPGGDVEATRPVWQAHRVRFAGRKGFLKLAREAGVPIVPMGIRGSHFTVPVLWQSEGLLAKLLVLPWLFGIKRFGLTLLGLAGAVVIAAAPTGLPWPARCVLVWLWLASPIPLLPWIPARIRIRIGPPMRPEELFVGAEPEALDEAYARVEGAVQALVSGK